MTLNAQERAAVEAAKAWVAIEDCTDTEESMSEEIGHANAADDEHLGTFGFACGHLSGFRAGVEAAIEALNKNNEDAGGAYVSDINAIRALLAQEAEHGS